MDESSAEEFGRLALELHDQPGLVETVDQVAQYALSAVGCDYADVIFVHRRHRIETMASTDAVAEKAAQLQLELQEGPALSMPNDDGSYLLVDDTIQDQRWPKWSGELAKLGIRSVLSTRLATSQSMIGVLNVYGRRPDCFDHDDVAVAHVLARHASVALAAARQESTLWQAIDARKVIGQAQGILMERFELSPDQAFAVLRRYSQEHNIKLNEVARLLIATRQLPSDGKRLSGSGIPGDADPPRGH